VKSPAETEVLVVGGGPVGLATAIEARLAGLDVVVIEPREGVIDKACGEGLMPGALPALERLGVAPAGFPLVGIDYRDGRRSARHRFAGGAALGVRRTTLHAALLERAHALGVGMHRGRVEDVVQDDTGVSAGGVRGSWLVACDGLHSPVARAVGLAEPEPRARRRYGQRAHYGVEPWTDFVEVHWTPLGELYVTPTAEGTIGVALLGRKGVRFDDALAGAPELSARLATAPRVTQLRGAGPFRQSTRARSTGRVLLAGDASGYVDALTAEGIRIGLDQAHAAISAITAGDREQYERDWDDITRDFRRLTGTLVRLAMSPLRGAIVPVSSALPGLYGAAVERIAR
jgi:flavin-dependent dehydrogenase